MAKQELGVVKGRSLVVTTIWFKIWLWDLRSPALSLHFSVLILKMCVMTAFIQQGCGEAEM